MNSFYGGRGASPFVIKKNYNSVDIMKSDGPAEVAYGEYALINNTADSKTHGNLYQRNYWDQGSSGEGEWLYIGNIAGPAGIGISKVEFIDSAMQTGTYTTKHDIAWTVFNRTDNTDNTGKILATIYYVETQKTENNETITTYEVNIHITQMPQFTIGMYGEVPTNLSSLNGAELITKIEKENRKEGRESYDYDFKVSLPIANNFRIEEDTYEGKPRYQLIYDGVSGTSYQTGLVAGQVGNRIYESLLVLANIDLEYENEYHEVRVKTWQATDNVDDVVEYQAETVEGAIGLLNSIFPKGNIYNYSFTGNDKNAYKKSNRQSRIDNTAICESSDADKDIWTGYHKGAIVSVGFPNGKKSLYAWNYHDEDENKQSWYLLDVFNASDIIEFARGTGASAARATGVGVTFLYHEGDTQEVYSTQKYYCYLHHNYSNNTNQIYSYARTDKTGFYRMLGIDTEDEHNEGFTAVHPFSSMTSDVITQHKNETQSGD